MYHIAIIDDDISVCHRIKNYLENVADELKIEVELSVWVTGEELYEYLKEGNRQDLIFLDIELVGRDGIWLGSMVREEMEDYNTAIVSMSVYRRLQGKEQIRQQMKLYKKNKWKLCSRQKRKYKDFAMI